MIVNICGGWEEGASASDRGDDCFESLLKCSRPPLKQAAQSLEAGGGPDSLADGL